MADGEPEDVSNTCLDPYLTVTTVGGIDTPAVAQLAEQVKAARTSRWESGEPAGKSGWIIIDHDVRKSMDDPKFCAWKKVLHCDGKSTRVVVDCDQIDYQRLNSAMVVDETVMCINTDPACKDDEHKSCEKACKTLYGMPPTSQVIRFRDDQKGLEIACEQIKPGTIVPDTGAEEIPYGSMSYTCKVTGDFADVLNLLHDEVQDECDASRDAACTSAAVLNPHEIWRKHKARQAGAADAAGAGAGWVDDANLHLKNYMVHMYDADNSRALSMSVEMAGLFTHSCSSEETGKGCKVGLGLEAIGVEFGLFPKPLDRD